MKNFNISCLDDFFVNEKMEIDNVLTLGDRQTIIKHALDNIRAMPQEKHVPGYEHIILYHGQSLVGALQYEELIANIYSLRDTVRNNFTVNCERPKKINTFLSSFS